MLGAEKIYTFKKSDMVDFNKKQLLISSITGSIVICDGTGAHTPAGCDFIAFSGVWVYDAIGENRPGDFCKTFSADAFNQLPADYFKR